MTKKAMDIQGAATYAAILAKLLNTPEPGMYSWWHAVVTTKRALDEAMQGDQS